MHFIKKLIGLFVSFIFMFSFINVPTVDAKTISDLQKDLAAKQKAAVDNNQKIKYTQQQIDSTKKNINKTYTDIDSIQREMIKTVQEIDSLNKKISDKHEQINKLMQFVQLSSSGNEYLEYIMGADTITEFIYRISVAEQLIKYNNDLMKQMNQMIKENKAKQVQLNDQSNDLKAKQVSLGKQLNILGDQQKDLEDFSRGIAEDIKTAQEVIQMYKNAGCGANEDINVCANRLLPPDTSFWRPFIQGVVTSEYGYRDQFVNGRDMTLVNSSKYPRALHGAIDISNSDKTNTKVYAAAAGKVAKIIYSSSGGGNQVIIHHNIIVNGKTQKYTTYYCHLRSISVGNGQVVSKDTVIGIMGSTGNSTGPHTHFGIAYGHWYKDYYAYSDFIAHTINPRIVINFPSHLSTYWYNRTTRYN